MLNIIFCNQKKIFLFLKTFILTCASFIFYAFFISPSVFSAGIEDVLRDADVRTGQQDVPLPTLDKENTAEDKTNSIIYAATQILLILSGMVAVIFLVLGGIEYVVSGGVEDRLNGAKSKIQYALIGLLVVIFSYALLTNFIAILDVPNTGVPGSS